MKKISYLLLPAFLLLFVQCKQTQKAVSDGQQKMDPIDNALLWKISGKGLDKDSYLYGTIHIIDAKDFFFPKGTLTSFEAAEEVTFGINMRDMTDMSKIMGIMSQIMMKDGLSLSDLVSEEDYALVKNHFDEMGLPMMMVERMKPMFLSVFGGGGMSPDDLQSGKMKSYEMEFFEMAKAQGKSTGGLETMEYQLCVFDSIPYKEQAEMLIETIKAGDTGGDEFKETLDLYLNQNLMGMSKMIEGNEDFSQYEDQLLNNRNKNWIPIMMTSMKTKSVFFAVGAAHLPGKYGVINLLREQGYKLTPLSI